MFIGRRRPGCTQPPCLATLSRDVFPDSAAPSDVRHYGRVERARSAASRRAFRKHRMAKDRASRRCPLIHTTSYAAVEKSTMLRSISFAFNSQPTEGLTGCAHAAKPSAGRNEKGAACKKRIEVVPGRVNARHLRGI